MWKTVQKATIQPTRCLHHSPPSMSRLRSWCRGKWDQGVAGSPLLICSISRRRGHTSALAIRSARYRKVECCHLIKHLHPESLTRKSLVQLTLNSVKSRLLDARSNSTRSVTLKSSYLHGPKSKTFAREDCCSRGGQDWPTKTCWSSTSMGWWETCAPGVHSMDSSESDMVLFNTWESSATSTR